MRALNRKARAAPPEPLSEVARALAAATQPEDARAAATALPAWPDVQTLVEDLRAMVFPILRRGRPVTARELAQLERKLARLLTLDFGHQVTHAPGALRPSLAAARDRAREAARAFVRELPALAAALTLDVRAAFEGDPAAGGTDEVILCYPGVYAISTYRLAHQLHLLGARTLPRMMTEHAHVRTGVDIHPGATIGRSFFIDHGTGVVIGETTVIGDRVRLYQGVTLGALSLPAARVPMLRGRKRHPTLEDDVIVYANATILGDTTIGKGAVVGGNAWIVQDVPAGARVPEVNGRIRRTP